MNKKKTVMPAKQGFLQRRKTEVKTYVKQSLKQPISIKEGKSWITTTSDSIKSLGKGSQLSWPDYAAKMRFSSVENIVRSYRNVTILFYICLMAFMFALLQLLYLIGASIGGEDLVVSSVVGTLLSLMISINLLIISSKELWMVYHEKAVDFHQWLKQLKIEPWSVFPRSLDYEKALNLFHYCNQPKSRN